MTAHSQVSNPLETTYYFRIPRHLKAATELPVSLASDLPIFMGETMERSGRNKVSQMYRHRVIAKWYPILILRFTPPALKLAIKKQAAQSGYPE
jgi:hypothetical protein